MLMKHYIPRRTKHPMAHYNNWYFFSLFAWKIDENDQDSPDPKKDIFSLSEFYDWKIIFKAISPLVLISTGAGLTIPFVNLFNSIFGFDSSDYSMMGSITMLFYLSL